MSFRRTLGLAGVLLSTAVLAQSETAPATVIAAEETAPAEVAELTEAHGEASAGDAAAGEAKAAVCAACHSTDGNSTDPQYPKLAGQHERYIARHLALYKSGERNNAIMLGFAATLSPQDMRDLGAYFSTKQVLPGMADDSVIADGPNAGKKFYEIGERLYRGGDIERGVPACIGCHGPAGRGNPGPAYPSLGGQHAPYTAAQLNAFRDGTVYGRGENANEVMAGVAKYLTDEEIGALASYIEGLHANPGTAGGK
ncbi:c-type cytochrome [Pseudomarimonas salicorniae]|uniref:Cytochrome c4 n=1 Tax=Pseudomarimonas salicorniae TaxID=2933270 RepID=A0ABT0GH70_9GAMM|nr:c-type cytochrome [Lysobacter sp. CAU 1642]MCK7593370.1 cytochrome c4 [Lysobacter sp. CAU 1642]